MLVVDDDVGVRDCLALILEDEGYDVRACATPKEGLFQLLSHPWDLVLTDYSMPEHTGLWLLQEAERAQSLSCPALILTALACQLPRTRFPVMSKPIEPDVLLRACREHLAAHSPELLERAVSEFVLYITDGSAECLRARRAVTRMLEEQGRGHELEIINLSRGGLDRAEKDRVTFTPTLVRRGPTPMWVVGVPSDPSVLTTVLM